jgi:hypothetical protein
MFNANFSSTVAWEGYLDEGWCNTPRINNCTRIRAPCGPSHVSPWPFMSPDKNQLSEEINSWARTNRAYKTQRQMEAVHRDLMRHREWRGYVRWSEVACAILIGWIINQCDPRFRFKIHVVNILFFNSNITRQRSTAWLYPSRRVMLKRLINIEFQCLYWYTLSQFVVFCEFAFICVCINDFVSGSWFSSL